MNLSERLLNAANEGAKKKTEQDKEALVIAELLEQNSKNGTNDETTRKENNVS